MDVVREQRWSRSKYPLQAPFQGSEQPHLAAAPLEEAEASILDQLPENTQGHDGAAPFYRAVIDHRTERYSATSPLGSDGKLSSNPPAEDIEATDPSSTAASISQTSTRIPSISNDQRSGLGDAEDASSLLELSSRNEASPEVSPWTRDAYPLQATIRSSEEPRPPTTSSAGGYEQSSAQVLENDQVRAMKKTLRRTTGSQRLRQIASVPLAGASSQRSPSPPAEVNKASPSVQPTENKQSVPALETDTWKRQAYPVQLMPSDPMTQHPIQPSFSQHRENQVSTGRASLNRQMYPFQAPTSSSTDLPVSPPSSETESGNITAHQSQESTKTAMGNKPRRRQAYPLQAPASTVNLRHSPTPPPSPRTDVEHLEEEPANQLRQTDQAATRNKKMFRRQVYPLQSPASVANLQRPQTPPSSPERESENVNLVPTDHTREDNETSKRSKGPRRQVYPLQSPASVADFQRSQTPPTSLEMKSENVDPTSESHRSQNSESTRMPYNLHRQAYPLQSSASIPALRSPSPLSAAATATEELQDTGIQSPVNRSLDHELATELTSHWRRQVYPLESPKNVPTFQRLPTPQPSEEEDEAANDQKPSSPIHLPKNICALKDASDQAYKGRTIIVCLDGTGDKFDDDNSNIVHLISALKKDDAHQVSYYQAGIGTYSAGGLSSGFAAAADMAIGSGLGLHVRDAYHFLMHSYKEGDKICIFGFSRGAYTARCLAGMIHKVGLLPPRNIQQIPFAYEFYKNDTAEGWTQSDAFKATFCINVNVYFVGCFDSVASVGFIPRVLPLSSTPTNKVRYFRHAMALDERRAKFKICRHQRKDYDDVKDAFPQKADAPPGYHLPKRYGTDHHPNVTDEEYRRLTAHEPEFDSDVLEVWFAGAHADVGGGAVANVERHKLAQIPLRWMIRQAFECNTGIIFKTKMLAEFGLDVHTLYPKYSRLSAPSHGPPPSFLEKYAKCLPPRSVRRSKLVDIHGHDDRGERLYHLKSHTDEDWTPEQVEDFYDAMTRINDQLVDAPTWWILELWPVEYKVPIAPGEVVIRTGMNLGRYRGVDDKEPNLHWTVLQRMQHKGYRINARTAAHTKWRTVV